jgi:peroxiredoxin
VKEAKEARDRRIRRHAGFPGEETGSSVGSLFSTCGREPVPARLLMASLTSAFCQDYKKMMPYDHFGLPISYNSYIIYKIRHILGYSMKKRALYLIIVALAGWTSLGALVQNQPAPAFSLKDLNGKALTLADYKGKVLILNFWATWCPPCRAEIPDFVEFYDQNKVNGLEIIGLSVDKLTPDQLKSFVTKNKMIYTVAFAPEKTIKDYGPIDAIPTTFVIDKKGIIRHAQVGIMDKKTLNGIFQKLSTEK